MREAIVWGFAPPSVKCVACSFTTDSFAALFAHCSETGHGSLPATPSTPAPDETTRTET